MGSELAEPKPKHSARITRDIEIEGRLAFKRNDRIQVVKIKPEPDNRDKKYMTFSKTLEKEVCLSEEDLVLIETSPKQRRIKQKNEPPLSQDTGMNQSISNPTPHFLEEVIPASKATVSSESTEDDLPEETIEISDPPPHFLEEFFPDFGDERILISLCLVSAILVLIGIKYKEVIGFILTGFWLVVLIWMLIEWMGRRNIEEKYGSPAINIVIAALIFAGIGGLYLNLYYSAQHRLTEGLAKNIVGVAIAGDARWAVISVERATIVNVKEPEEGDSYLAIRFEVKNFSEEEQTPIVPTIFDSNEEDANRYDSEYIWLDAMKIWGENVHDVHLSGGDKAECYGIYSVPEDATDLVVVVSGFALMEKQQARIPLENVEEMNISVAKGHELAEETDSTPPAPDYSSQAGDVGLKIADIMDRFADTNDRVTVALTDLLDYPSIEAAQSYMNSVSADTLPIFQQLYNEMRVVQKQAEGLKPTTGLEASHGQLLKGIDCYCRSLLEYAHSVELLQNINRSRLEQSNQATDNANALMAEGTSYVDQATVTIPSLKQ